MGRNAEKDAIEMAAKNQRILENGFRIFAEHTIERVKMTDVAEAAGIGIASLYRYYKTKPELVMGISTWVWGEYGKESIRKLNETPGKTAAEEYDFLLESFLDLYVNHKNILRFNQLFNVYLQSERISQDQIQPYTNMVLVLEERFVETYRKVAFCIFRFAFSHPAGKLISPGPIIATDTQLNPRGRETERSLSPAVSSA